MLKISMYRKGMCFCLYGTFLPVTSSFHPFPIRRRSIFELFCESIKICAFRNSESTCWTAYRCFLFAYIQTPNVWLRPLTMSSLKNMCFQNMCAETTLEEFAISLVLVISCEPVIVETESRNFSDLEAQRVYRWR